MPTLTCLIGSHTAFALFYEAPGGAGGDDDVPELSDSEDEDQWIEEGDERQTHERVLCLFCDR